MKMKIQLDRRSLGIGEPPYVIAEIGSNHNGDMQLCKRLVDAAITCGADAVKFQSWTKETLISKTEFRHGASYVGKDRQLTSLEEELERFQLTEEMHHQASGYCREKGMTFFSSCLTPDEVDLLDSLDVPAFKIPSGEINNLRLLEYVAVKGRPVILSTGMATLGEVEKAVSILRSAGNNELALLHCISLYPPEYRNINLRNIATLQQAFQVPVGFSDHSIGTAIPLAAIALGACIIEKHFTLDKQMKGWDHAVSADPAELETIVREGRNIYEALGSAERIVDDQEMTKRRQMRRSLVLKRDLEAGHILGEADIDFKRPGSGIRPDELEYALGKRLARDMQTDDIITWSDLE
ncbi:MAG: N-acetylneuraminate synthase family protein [Candidatus Glassbacteria bacterium]|nr:N-acetylneuraminate synthase family protein [Candidatus Glassbacteria bacterium]